MKQFQVMVKNTKGISAINKSCTVDAKFFLDTDDYTQDVGYDTLSATKRIATMATKNPEKYGLKTDDEITAVTTDEMIAEYNNFIKADNKAFTKALMQKYYPQREAEIQAEYGDSAEAPAIEPAKTKVKPVRKPKARKSPLDLTEKQIFFLDNMRKDDFYEHGLDSTLWIDILVDTLSNLGMNPMTTGAMISTLREKGLISIGKEQREKRRLKVFNLTELGKEAMVKYGLDK